MFEKMIEINMLYDFYGQLLTSRQKEILKLYYEDNYSLSEIAEAFGISRQGVHDTIKKSEKALHGYESRLGLVQKFGATEEVIEAIDLEIDMLIRENSQNKRLAERLQRIKSIIGKINE